MKTLAQMQPASSGPTMNQEPIRRVLGEDMPELTPTPLGRYRLVTALRSKFGASFRNYPQAAEALSHFDSELSYFSKIREIGGT